MESVRRMTQKSNDTIVRKLPLPLQIKIGADTTITDGFFTLTSRDASQIKIISIDQDGYATVEISAPHKEKRVTLTEIFGGNEPIGIETSKTHGRGKDFGQYRYYRKVDGSLYVVISGKREHTLHLGKLSDRESPISIIAKTIAYKFDVRKFSRKELFPLIPQHLRYGQMVKSVLDAMHLEGFLDIESSRSKKNRPMELYKGTDKLKKLIIASPEQA